MTEPPISDYALIGDTRTAALCSSAGSIDWMCVPAFDGKPLFGRLVGGDEGGSFVVSVDEVVEVERRYRARSAILGAEIASRTGTGSTLDGMVVDVSGGLLPQLLLIRRLECKSGRLFLRINFDPKLGLPGRRPRAAKRGGALVCEWGSLAVALRCSPELDLTPGREVSIELPAGSALTMVMSLADRSPLVFVTPERADEILEDTDAWWRGWASETDYGGPFAEEVLRSLITLQLLTFSPSGAPVAAPTTSLPEEIGGSRNWDYRFSWPRDASIGVAASLGLGKPDLAHSYMHWLLHASRLSRPRLTVLYTLYGKRCPKERDVDGVPGYRGSLPVRVGNAASRQHQLDVYGWVVDAAWVLTTSGRRLHPETWRALSSFSDFVAKHWAEPDAGIWEVRGKTRHYVHSKLMAWLCLDRALRISATHRVRERRKLRWIRARDSLAAAIRDRGFDQSKNSYVRAFGSTELDAAILVMPVLGFDDDPRRLEGTIAAVRRNLEIGHGILYRYPPGTDDLEGGEGAFLPCSFWLVQALALTGRREQATELFTRLLGLANDVGLFGEEIDPDTKDSLGNFPQAFTHATLIQAAMALEETGN